MTEKKPKNTGSTQLRIYTCRRRCSMGTNWILDRQHMAEFRHNLENECENLANLPAVQALVDDLYSSDAQTKDLRPDVRLTFQELESKPTKGQLKFFN